jgi:hypothetical protein
VPVVLEGVERSGEVVALYIVVSLEGGRGGEEGTYGVGLESCEFEGTEEHPHTRDLVWMKVSLRNLKWLR